MKCTIKDVGLTKAFDVDGKTVFPSAYMTYAPLKEDFEDMKKHGINLFMFGAYAGDEGINWVSGLKPFCEHFFKGYGEYDFSGVEKIMNMINPDAKDDVYVIPRVCLEPPKWWQELNPSETGMHYQGQSLRCCYASEKWRQDMTVALYALIDYFENSKWKDTVLGYHIAAGGTEEWAYNLKDGFSFCDYSACNLNGYIKWLKDKYTDLSELSEAWGRKLNDWADVQFPNPAARTYAKSGFLRTKETEMDVLDFFDYHNEIVADTINYFCKQVKEYTHYTRVTGAFYGYLAVLPLNDKGLHATDIILKQPYVDFISSTNWYKEPGGAWVMASTVQSALMHGKMWIAEGDLRTSKATNMSVYLPHAVPNNDYYTKSAWDPLATMEDSESVLIKGLARILTAPCGIWWFGMFGRWFSDERMMRIIEKTASLLEKQTRNYLQPEVAVIIDEKSYKYYGVCQKELYAVIDENMNRLSHAGFPFDHYILSDVQDDRFPVDQYKMYIFVNCIDIDEKSKKAIEQKLKTKNKTLFWLHCSSYFDQSVCDFELLQRDTDFTEVVDFNKEKYCDIGHAYEQGAYSIPTLKFAKQGGYVVARFDQSREPAVMYKNLDGYSSVYSLTLAPSSNLYRHIAVMAGVHIYNYTGDCVYAGGEYAGIHAMQEGYRRIALPGRCYQATNALTGTPMIVNNGYVDVYMQKYESLVIHVTQEGNLK